MSLTPRRSLLGQLWHGDDRRRVGAPVLALARPSATTTGREKVDRQHASALRTYLRLPWSFEQVVIFAAALVVLTGCVFRFTALERKVYWHDETITSIRIAGYPYGPFVDTIPGGERFSVHYLQRYQQVSGRGVLDTARSLADGDPQHPPLYYELARLWGKWIGDSVGSLRALSAGISVLALAAMFLFCRVLFESRLAGWLGVAVLAASPFQLFYAQEAREYALWSLLTLLSCVALMYAVREPAKKRGWLIYCLSLVLSLYAFVLTLFVIAAHAVIVVATARSRLRQIAIPFLACVGVAVLAITPWLLVMYRHRAAISATNGWTREAIPRVDLLRSWLSSLGLDFFANPWSGTAETLASLPFLALCLYAGYVLIRTARRWVSLTVGSLFVAAAVPFMLADFVLGGERSITARYMTPALLAIQLAVVYLLVTKLRSKQLLRRVLWSGVALLIVVAGFASWANSIGARTWPLKDDGTNRGDLFVARVLNAQPRPLLVATGFNHVLVLVHLLRGDVQVALATRHSIPAVAPAHEQVFVYGSPNGGDGTQLLERLKARFEREGYRVIPVASAPTCCGESPRPQLLRIMTSGSRRP